MVMIFGVATGAKKKKTKKARAIKFLNIKEKILI
jgi:hypothetical protein